MTTADDVRRRFAHVADTQGQPQDAPTQEAAAPAYAKRKFVASSKQRQMIVNMITERFSSDNTPVKYSEINWDDMTRPQFDNLFKALKAIPRPSKTAAGPRTTAQVVGLVLPPLPFDTYTVRYADDTYKVIMLDMQDLEDDFMPGKVVLRYQSGPDNTRDFTGFAHLYDNREVKVWRKHQNNPELTRAIAVMAGRPQEGDEEATVTRSFICGKCHRPLTTPTSQDLGFGPDCAKKLGLA